MNKILFIAFLLSCVTSFSQDKDGTVSYDDLTFGEPGIIGRFQILGMNDNDLLGYTTEVGPYGNMVNFQFRLNLYRFDNNLKVEKEALHVTPKIQKANSVKGSTMYFLGVKYLNDKIVVFYSIESRGNEMAGLYHAIFDPVTFTPIKISTSPLLTYRGREDVAREYYSPKVPIIVESSKKGKFGIIQFGNRKNDEPIILHFAILDDELEKIQTTKFEFRAVGENITFGNIQISEMGKLYFQTEEKNDEGIRKFIHVVNKDKIRKHEFETDGRTLKGYYTTFLPDGNVMCAGYYKSPEDSGVFKYILTDQLVKVSAKFSPFNLENTYNCYDQETPETDVNFNNHVVKDVVFLDNGDYLVVSDADYYDLGKQTFGIYFTGNIMVSKCNAAGDVLWTRVMKKFQRTGDGSKACLSFVKHKGEENLYFLFNDQNSGYDEAGNPKQPDFNSIKEYDFPALSMVKLNMESGEVEKRRLVHYRRGGEPITQNTFYSDEEGSTLYFFRRLYSGSSGRIGKIYLE